MTRLREWLVFAAVAVAAAAAGFGYNAWRTASPETAGVAADALTALLNTPLPDLEQRSHRVAQWRGQVVVVNFWATWCTPCREEIPLFVKLQKQHGAQGLQFVGIAIDQPAKVKAFATELGMNFPVLTGGAELIDLTRKLGNRAGVLPFTVILDRSGKVVAAEIGTAHNATLEARLQTLLSARSGG